MCSPSTFISHAEKRLIAVRSGFAADLTPFKNKYTPSSYNSVTRIRTPALYPTGPLRKDTSVHFEMMVTDDSASCAPTQMAITAADGKSGLNFEVLE